PQLFRTVKIAQLVADFPQTYYPVHSSKTNVWLPLRPSTEMAGSYCLVPFGDLVMKRFVTTSLFLVAFGLIGFLPSVSEAGRRCGGRHHGGCGSDCCVSTCAPSCNDCCSSGHGHRRGFLRVRGGCGGGCH